ALVAETATPSTPLERQLDRVGRRLVGVSLGACAAVLGLGLLRGVPLLEMARSAISLAVAAVPEGLPAVATTTLALGTEGMARRRAHCSAPRAWPVSTIATSGGAIRCATFVGAASGTTGWRPRTTRTAAC